MLMTAATEWQICETLPVSQHQLLLESLKKHNEAKHWIWVQVLLNLKYNLFHADFLLFMLDLMFAIALKESNYTKLYKKLLPRYTPMKKSATAKLQTRNLGTS